MFHLPKPASAPIWTSAALNCPAFALVAMLVACSGGESVNLPEPTTGVSPGSNDRSEDSGGGHWWGALADGDQVLSDAMCLLIESGELTCVLIDNSAEDSWLVPLNRRLRGAVHGNIIGIENGQPGGSGQIYAAPGHYLVDGTSTIADIAITAAALKRSNSLIELTFTTLGRELTFSGYYDHYYREGDLIWAVDGVYREFDIFGDPASLTVGPDGLLFMQSAGGCVGNGQMTRVGSHYNAHTMTLAVSDCAGLDGTYSGLATLLDFSWVNGTNDLLLMVFTTTTAIVGQGVM